MDDEAATDYEQPWVPPKQNDDLYENQHANIINNEETEKNIPEEETNVSFVPILKPFQWHKPWRTVTVTLGIGDKTETRVLDASIHPVKVQFMAYFKRVTFLRALKSNEKFVCTSVFVQEDGSIIVEITTPPSNDNVFIEIEDLWKKLISTIDIVSISIRSPAYYEFLPDILQEEVAGKKLWMCQDGRTIYIVFGNSDRDVVSKAVKQINDIKKKFQYYAKIPFDPLILQLLKCGSCMNEMRATLRPVVDAHYVITTSHLWVFSEDRIEINLIKKEVYTRFACSCFPSYDSSHNDEFTKIVNENISKRRLVIEQSPYGVLMATTTEILRLLWLSNRQNTPRPIVPKRNKYVPKVMVDEDDDDPSGEYILMEDRSEQKPDFHIKSLISDSKRSCHEDTPVKVTWYSRSSLCDVGPIKDKISAKIKTLERRHKCSLEVNVQLRGCEQVAQQVNNMNGIHLILVHGDYRKCQSDVICLETQKTFMNKTFSLTNDTYDLPCAMTAQLSSDIWLKPFQGNLPIIQKTIEEILVLADKASFSSLSIPVDIFRKNIMSELLCNYIIEAIRAWMNQATSLRAIYVCCGDVTVVREVMKEFKKEKSGLEFYDLYSCQSFWDVSQGATLTKKMKVQIVKGNILEQKVDVIMNSVNKDLDLTKGMISRQITSQGGKDVTKDLKRRFPNGVNFGTVVTSEAGNLPFKKIYHVALPPWTRTAKFSLEILSKVVYDSLTLLRNSGYTSIAFPVFGTGALGYPWKPVAETMLNTIERFRPNSGDIDTVNIVLYPNDVTVIKVFNSCKDEHDQRELKEINPNDPTEILDARANGIRVLVTHMEDIKYSNCDCVVEINVSGKSKRSTGYTSYVDSSDEKERDLTSSTAQMVASSKKRFSITSDDHGLKKCVKTYLELALSDRISSLALHLRFAADQLSYLKQVKTIKDMVFNDARLRYLERVEIIIADKEAFDSVIREVVEEKDTPKRWTLLGSEEKHKFRKIKNYPDVQQSSIVFTASLTDSSVLLSKLKCDLQQVVDDV